MKMKERNTFLFHGRTKTLYFMTLIALVAMGAIGYLLVPTSGTVSAQDVRTHEGTENLPLGVRSKTENRATPGMIAFALANRTNNLADMYSALNQLPCEEVDGADLGGKTFGAGVYCLSSAKLAGEMILDAQNDVSSNFIFRVAGALEAMNESNISLINKAQASNVFFVADSANVAEGSNFRAGIVTKNAINVAGNARVSGRTLSLSGEVVAPASVDGGGNGTLEICKRVTSTTGNLENRIYFFTVTGANIPAPITVSVRAGFCTAPFDVPNGTATVTELLTGTNLNGEPTFGNFQLTGVNVLSVAGPSTLGTVNLPARTASVTIANSGVSNQLSLEFVNRFAITGFIEICKRAATGDPDVPLQGTFSFTVEGVFTGAAGNTLQIFTAPVGQCTGAISVTRPFDRPLIDPPGPRQAVVRVTELGQAGSFLESAFTIPADREVGPIVGGVIVGEVLGLGVNAAGGTFANPGGGYVPVRILEGDESLETIVNFVNRSRPGQLKICKIAGPGIPLNRIFTFSVSGTGPTNAAGTIGAVTRTVEVAAGTAASGGTCSFVPGFGSGTTGGGTERQTFVIGTNITIVETGPITIGGNEVRVSRVRSTSGGTRPNEFTVVVPARRDVVEVEFTNFIFQPSILKICKIGGAGITQNAPFTFNVTQVSPVGLGGNLFPDFSTTATVNAGPAAQGGNCTIVSGAGLIGGAFNQGSTITLSEATATGTIVSNITSTTSTIPAFVAGVRATTLSGQNGIVEGVTQVTFTNTGTAPRPVSAPFDFDGDAKADLSVFRSSNGGWYINQSTAGFTGVGFGQAGDRIVPADYDGDGKTDVAVYRPSNGTWYLLQSTAGFAAMNFGIATDIPQAADFNNDGRADLAVFRPSNGTWYVMNLVSGEFTATQFGQAGDQPVAADYDGDGTADYAVYRNGGWYILRSQLGFTGVGFGQTGDKPVAADYDGDGKVDIAVYRPSNGTWYLLQSTAGFAGTAFGISTDMPAPADYDGDGKADITVFRPSNGMFYHNLSASGFTGKQFGQAGDQPAANAFVSLQ